MTIAQMAKTVGYVFQSPSHMLFAPTVREELAFGPDGLERFGFVVHDDVCATGF